MCLISEPGILKPSIVRAKWLSDHPWYELPYYRCPRKMAFTHGRERTCCWDAALKDWIKAIDKPPPAVLL